VKKKKSKINITRKKETEMASSDDREDAIPEYVADAIVKFFKGTPRNVESYLEVCDYLKTKSTVVIKNIVLNLRRLSYTAMSIKSTREEMVQEILDSDVSLETLIDMHDRMIELCKSSAVGNVYKPPR